MGLQNLFSYTSNMCVNNMAQAHIGGEEKYFTSLRGSTNPFLHIQ